MGGGIARLCMRERENKREDLSSPPQRTTGNSLAGEWNGRQLLSRPLLKRACHCSFSLAHVPGSPSTIFVLYFVVFFFLALTLFCYFSFLVLCCSYLSVFLSSTTTLATQYLSLFVSCYINDRPIRFVHCLRGHSFPQGWAIMQGIRNDSLRNWILFANREREKEKRRLAPNLVDKCSRRRYWTMMVLLLSFNFLLDLIM